MFFFWSPLDSGLHIKQLGSDTITSFLSLSAIYSLCRHFLFWYTLYVYTQFIQGTIGRKRNDTFLMLDAARAFPNETSSSREKPHRTEQPPLTMARKRKEINEGLACAWRTFISDYKQRVIHTHTGVLCKTNWGQNMNTSWNFDPHWGIAESSRLITLFIFALFL